MPHGRYQREVEELLDAALKEIWDDASRMLEEHIWGTPDPWDTAGIAAREKAKRSSDERFRRFLASRPVAEPFSGREQPDEGEVTE